MSCFKKQTPFFFSSSTRAKIRTKNGREKSEWEFLDGCSWFYDEDEALSEGKAICENIEFLDEDWEK